MTIKSITLVVELDTSSLGTYHKDQLQGQVGQRYPDTASTDDKFCQYINLKMQE
jgi:hypothetical protein